MRREDNLASGNAGVDARLAGARAEGLGLLAVVVALEGLADLLGAGGAGVGDGGGVAVVGVDTSEELAAGGLDVLDGDGALGAVALAVTARPVELAEVLDGEAVDGHGGGTVVLDDLVLGAAGSTALDDGGSGALEGEGVLADGRPPDVCEMLAGVLGGYVMGRKRTLESAGALAVDTLDLVGTDDDVLEGGTVLELEDGVLVAALSLTSALDTTAVGLEATVEGALDDLGGLVGDGALGSGNVEAEAALNDLRSRGSRGADGESAEKGGSDGSEGRHCC